MWFLKVVFNIWSSKCGLNNISLKVTQVPTVLLLGEDTVHYFRFAMSVFGPFMNNDEGQVSYLTACGLPSLVVELRGLYSCSASA